MKEEKRRGENRSLLSLISLGLLVGTVWIVSLLSIAFFEVLALLLKPFNKKEDE